MGVQKTEYPTFSSLPADEVFARFFLDMDIYITKVFPQGLKSVEVLEGDGRSVGSIKLFTLADATMKTRIDAIDEEASTYTHHYRR